MGAKILSSPWDLEQNEMQSQMGGRWRRIRSMLREPLGEFLGTLILVFLGDAVVAQKFCGARTSYEMDFLAVPVAWGLAIMVASLVTAPLMSAHMNPAVTIASALFSGFSWAKVLPAIAAQTAGAAAGAALVLSVYPNMPRSALTRNVFSTYPSVGVSTGQALWTEIIATFVLILMVFAAADSRNKLEGHKGSIAIGITIMTIGLTLGFNTGYALNPARDLGPRLVSLAAGWGEKTFSYRNYAWVPIVGPILGGILGGAVYKFIINNQDDEEAEEATK